MASYAIWLSTRAWTRGDRSPESCVARGRIAGRRWCYNRGVTTNALTIRLVVGGNAILECGDARVLVYASTLEGTAAIELPPRKRWEAVVATDFPLSYDEVTDAIERAGYGVVVSKDAGLSSSSARAGHT